MAAWRVAEVEAVPQASRAATASAEACGGCSALLVLVAVLPMAAEHEDR